MKKCPYCKAEIEESSRFCLYCMTSLDEKKPVSPPRKRRWPLMIVALLVLLAVVLFLIPHCIRHEDAPSSHPKATAPTTGSSEPQTEVPVTAPSEDTATEAPSSEGVSEEAIPGETTQPEETEDPPAQDPTIPTAPSQPGGPTETTAPQPTATEPPETRPTQPTATEPPETKPTQPVTSSPTEPSACSHRYQLTENHTATCTKDGRKVHTCSLCGDSYQEAVPAIGHAYREATCLQPQICRECSAVGEAALGHSYQKGACIRCGIADPTDPRMVYEYRAVRGGDQLPSGQYDPATDVVITGIKTVAADGVYQVPAYIDGYRVVGIMSLSFSGTDARRVTLGKNIIYVAQNAFSGCYNIEALYVRSDALYLSRSAFIPASGRNCTMKIYCSATCTINDALDGKCYLKDKVRIYGGEYQEWNG